MAQTSNILVMQSGGVTPVMNRSLYGVAREAAAHKALGSVYGAVHGLEGLVAERLVDLGACSKTALARVARTPGGALGSTRRKLKPDDIGAIIDALKRHGIRYCFIIGGNDSAETGHTLAREARFAGYELSVMLVPKTIDNDLVLTDHCPGFGSAARFVALATMGAGRDAEAMGEASPITIIEVMGRDAGWLAASSALAKREERDAPHFIGVPEVPIDETLFLDRMEEAYGRFGFAVAVVAENARGPGGVLGGEEEPWFVDDFGHRYYDGPARHLAAQAARRLKVRVRHEKPGTIQRSLVACISRTDADEAEMVGRAAVRHALDGHSDEMVTIERTSGARYASTTGLAPLEAVAGQVKTLPDSFLNGATGLATDAFLDYLRPLVGSPLPRFGRLL
ncbi:MAG: diphosphate--fructose-6-phosphate 1-phosphotransferase [Chloroflexi bacterium]|nr:diphosphate--fructose-6-phosphate 1-phosphotransferase [Chloroflexota bacterium]